MGAGVVGVGVVRGVEGRRSSGPDLLLVLGRGLVVGLARVARKLRHARLVLRSQLIVRVIHDVLARVDPARHVMMPSGPAARGQRGRGRRRSGRRGGGVSEPGPVANAAQKPSRPKHQQPAQLASPPPQNKTKHTYHHAPPIRFPALPDPDRPKRPRRPTIWSLRTSPP